MKKEKMVPHTCDEVPMKGEFQEIIFFADDFKILATC
jgi:hypothetical protein